MNYATTLILMVLFTPLYGLSQDVNSTSESTNTEISNPDVIIENVSSNAASSTITVHTFKFFGKKTQSMVINDSDPKSANSTNVDAIISSFLDVEGVSRCTFDNATQSFTVLSGPTINLSEVVNQINQK